MSTPESDGDRTALDSLLISFGDRDKGFWLRLLAGLGMLVGAAAYVASEVPGDNYLLVIIIAGVVL